jgi:hypothetical protein
MLTFCVSVLPFLLLLSLYIVDPFSYIYNCYFWQILKTNVEQGGLQMKNTIILLFNWSIQLPLLVFFIPFQFSQHNLLRRLLSPHYMILVLSRIRWKCLFGLILDILICPNWSVCLYFFLYHTVFVTMAL